MPVSHVILEDLAFTNHGFYPPPSNRREKDILPVSPQPLLKPTTEELYSHLYTQHPESLELGERDWKMELFGMGPFMDQ